MAVALRDDGVEQSLGLLYAASWSKEVREILFAPTGFGTDRTLGDAYQLLADRGIDLSERLLPLCVVDEASIACVVMEDLAGLQAGDVVRLILNDVEPNKQLALLDTNPLLYISSLDEEFAAREPGLKRVLDQIGPAYEASHLAHEKRPRDYVIRPVRIACQNVIVALGAIAQDSSFDGLSVVAWQTCEVPHVATHEANRALAALTLCDAFQNGGTMEVRFDREARVSVGSKPVRFQGHPEHAVPASLRRFGRTVGVALGAEDPAVITPAEARELFLAITRMPDDLRSRVETAVERRGITPERMCFSLLSQVWREVELDFMLATTARARSILDGGAAWTDRASRQAETQVCRGAVMTGMLFRRLNGSDAAAANEDVRVVEDRSKGVIWHVDEENGSVIYSGIDRSLPFPWTRAKVNTDQLTVFPRAAATAEVVANIRATQSATLRAILLPSDVSVPAETGDVIVLRCPERLADIDKDIERRLLTSRISRG